jgi:chitinase
MKQKNLLTSAFATLLVVLFCSTITVAQFKTVGYMPSWAGSPADIQYSKLTHINYAFIRPTTTGGLTAVDQPSKLQDIVSRAHAAGVKVGIAIGGWSDLNNQDFESTAANATYRNNFVNNVVNLINQYGLDGVDIDWEYPTGGNNPANFNTLMGQLSTAMHSRGKFLTAAVAASGSNADGVQAGVFSSVDFLNLMAYDGGGSNHSTYTYAVQTINYWKGRGLPAAKAILGVPFYGRSSSEYVAYNTLLSRGASANSDFFGSIGYNGIPTIKSKTNLAFDQAGGIMIWELSQDVNNANSLLTAINQVVIERGGGGGCSGTYTSLPATLQAESYCTMSGIQTETTTDAGGGQNVGYIDANDYMIYRVNVPTTGSYRIQYRIASQNGGGSIRFERAGGSPVFGTIAVPSTGGWQTWQTITHNVNLTAGQQEVAIAAAAGGFNINWFSITPNSSSFSTTIQAESYSSMSGIQTETCSEGGLNVGWIETGDWMAYSITIPAAGTYRVIYRVASPNASRTLRLEKDNGTTQLGSVTIPNTGGWQNWANVAHNVTLPAGTYTIGIATSTGGFNLNYLTVTNNLSARVSTEEDFATEEEDNTLSVFPNPSAGRVTISVSKPSHVKILDASGRIFHSSFVEESLTVDRMNTGVYIVLMQNSMRTRTQKLVFK